jgi:hypothetical protein
MVNRAAAEFQQRTGQPLLTAGVAASTPDERADDWGFEHGFEKILREADEQLYQAKGGDDRLRAEIQRWFGVDDWPVDDDTQR